MRALYLKCSNCLNNETKAFLGDLGLFILRVGAGGLMLAGHGWGKFMSFPEKYTMFPDPLGIGSPLSMTLATGAEFFCSILLILGFATRLSAIPLAITMLVAAFIFHAEDPWQKKEFAVLYLVPFITLIFTGGGKYSIDGLMTKKTVEK